VTRHRLLLLLLFSLLLGGAAGVAGLWYFFGGTAPAEADIDTAARPVSSARPGTTPGTAVDANGDWTVDTSIGSFSDYSGTWAGFRVAEVLDNVGDTEAVGRTPNVSGSLALDGDTLSAVTIDVDLTTIRSDRDRRDPAIQRTLETGSFPAATFELTEPIDLPSTPADGATYDVTAHGDLTIHGITKPVDVALQARLATDTIVVVGSTPFTFSDFGMTAPRAPIVLSVADGGSIEFQLFFTRT
jgi:polyisoprenoid-binding protein YceI